MRWLACWLWLLIPSLVQAQPDTVLFNGKLVRFDAAPAEALAIRDGRIVALGTSAQIQALAGPATQVIDLEGRTVIPGLIDLHIHAIRAGLTYTTEVHWIGARSIDEALDRLRAAAARAPKGSWLIVAGGWIEGQFAEKRRPTQAEIAAAAPEHRVYVQVMYSAALLTRGGLEALGILEDAELGSRLTVDVDPSGTPTGWVSGDARTISDLYDKLPRPTLEQQAEGTRAFFRELNSLGITGVLDPGGYNLPIDAYRAVFKLWREHGLTLRVVYSLCAPRRNHELEDFQALTAMLPMGFGDDWLKFNGIGENVTWGMYNNDAPSEPQKEQLYRTLRWAAQRGLTATFHWNNNRSVHHLLDVLERVNRETPIAPLRWSIAHLNDASLENLTRIKALGAGWLMQNGVLFPGRCFPRPARRRGDPACASDRQRAQDGNSHRRRHRRAPGDVVQPIRIPAMDARWQDNHRPADAHARRNADAHRGAALLYRRQRVVFI